ncbi:unnamed protein product [[Candida] boidinii]|nr:unnamed protein product [[Candida] boidinii]
MGCSIIYLDLLYKSLFPSLFRKYPFDISNNTSFLICSLSLSAGCLLFTSMFKLLPEALKYFGKIPALSKDSQKLMSSSLGFYMLGIVICGLLNVVVHFFTSESIVHCVHDHEGEEVHDDVHENGHSHSHGHGHGHLHNDSQSQARSHSHGDPFSQYDADSHSHSHSHSHSSSSISDEGLKRKSLTDSTETSPLLNRNIKLSIENDGSKSSSDESFESDHPHTSSQNCKTHPHSQTDIIPSPTAINYNSTTNISDDPHHLDHSSSRPFLDKRESLMDMALKALKGTVCEGKCLGYDSVENCCLKTTSKPVLLLDRNNHSDLDLPHTHSQNCHIHSAVATETGTNNSIDNRNDPAIVKKQVNLHYCELPSSENILFFDKSRSLIKNNSKLNIEFPELQVISPLIKDDGNHHILENNIPHIRTATTAAGYDIENQQHQTNIPKPANSANNNLTPEASNDSDYFNLTQHHHHVTTPLSRLLSIGLQTVLAITLHKFPEGFVMYSTSQADPKLGLSIFLSMFIHNFVEGFTMTLPIYIALNSRIKALLIAGTLGSLAQPFGAFLGYLLFKDALLDMDDPQTNFIFGSLIAITSGFLTIIGFQMFASSISFGGRQSTVLIWMCIGIALICFSTILIASTE